MSAVTLFTAPFNNMRTVEFETHHANAFYAAVNHVADLSENKYNISEGLKGHVPEL